MSGNPRRVNTFDVFVGNLPPDVDQKKVGKIFSKFGEIFSIWIGTSLEGHKYSIVKFYCEEDGIKAIEETNGTLFEGGKPISVKKHMKRANRKKDGDTEDGQEDDGKPDEPMRPRNPDIVPAFETSQGYQNRRESEKLMISHVETPIMMWGQRLSQDNATELAAILEQLSILCPEAPKLSGKPESDKLYGAQYSEDGCWYRCLIRYTFSPDRVKVQYIDFGNTEEVNPSNLVELPKSVTVLPPCAMKLVLHSLWCNNNQDQTAIKFLKDLVEGKEVEAYTTARLSDGTGFYAELYIDGTSVNEKMMENNYAFKKPGLEQRGPFKGRGPGGDAMAMNSMKGGFMNKGDMPRKFESEKDEINNLRWKLKNLQTEYTSLSNKAQENDMSTQIKNLQVLTSTVRKLRNQFPLDRETPLDEAISLVQGPGKIGVGMAESLPEVISAINTYRTVQDEIAKCSDQTIMKEKTDTRNDLRRDLHEKLTTTVAELNKVPLQDRGKRVQDVVAALTKYYDTFTKLAMPNLPPLDSLLPSFEEWKVKKKSDVVGARQMSDLMESSVTTMFTMLQNVLSLKPKSEEVELTDDLDEVLKNYAKALQQEIAVADSENDQDAMLIGSLVQCLLRELSEEAQCVEHLGNVLQEFSALKEDITPWLNATPTTNDLQAVRSKLKSLKSKLRHKIADKADAEENHETEELEEIAKDLEEIRGKIHKALKEEDKILSELSELASAHFPELLSGDSDVGLNANLSHKGLVKLSAAPDQYKLTSVGSSSSGMFLSQYDGEPVFIKEYFLSNGSHLNREEFLNQMALYSNASSPFLEPVNAVFFAKNDRNAYVQVKKQGELLSTLVENSALTHQQCQTVVKDLCQALYALNLFNFVHGQVQPEFIVVDEEGHAKLLPPDFSLSDADRCRSRYCTKSGLDIIAPEMKQTMIPIEPSHSVDIYCLALLTLWIHHPNVQFQERKDGSVDFSVVPMDRNLSVFLMRLMCPNPMGRPAADNCLRSEYLCQLTVPEPPAQSSSRQSPVSSSMDGKSGQDMTRNSQSPASVLSQNSNDGIVYAESGAGVQMIANTRVPPPPLDGQPVTGGQPGSSFNPNLPPSLQQQQQQQLQQQQLQQQQLLQQQYQRQQIQQQLIQQQLQQQRIEQQQQQQQQEILEQQQQLQQQQQQQQQQSATNYEPSQNKPTAKKNDVFEIGTFDPNAYEVVTSPKSSEEEVAASQGPTSGEGGSTNEWGDQVDDSESFKDAEDSEKVEDGRTEENGDEESSSQG